MAKILVAYSTVDGQTRRICERIRDRLSSSHSVELAEITDRSAIDIGGHDCVVIGASIRYGKHRPSVFRFIDRHRAALEAKPTAFFTVNVVARKAAKSTPETNPYMGKFLEQARWKPTLLGVFAGKIDYRRYGPLDRTMIRFIMWMTKGPTAPDTCVEFTDWDAVDRFASELDAVAARVPR
jgi:menaquinone-dependent protoporphyrinogen oxidase